MLASAALQSHIHTPLFLSFSTHRFNTVLYTHKTQWSYHSFSQVENSQWRPQLLFTAICKTHIITVQSSVNTAAKRGQYCHREQGDKKAERGTETDHAERERERFWSVSRVKQGFSCSLWPHPKSFQPHGLFSVLSTLTSYRPECNTCYTKAKPTRTYLHLLCPGIQTPVQFCVWSANVDWTKDLQPFGVKQTPLLQKTAHVWCTDVMLCSCLFPSVMQKPSTYYYRYKVFF